MNGLLLLTIISAYSALSHPLDISLPTDSAANTNYVPANDQNQPISGLELPRDSAPMPFNSVAPAAGTIVIVNDEPAVDDVPVLRQLRVVDAAPLPIDNLPSDPITLDANELVLVDKDGTVVDTVPIVGDVVVVDPSASAVPQPILRPINSNSEELRFAPYETTPNRKRRATVTFPLQFPFYNVA